MYKSIDQQISDSQLRAGHDPGKAKQRAGASRSLIDLLASEDLIRQKEEAAKRMQAQAPGAPPTTIAEQKEQQVRQMTMAEVGRSMGLPPGPPPGAQPPQMPPMRPRPGTVPRRGMPPGKAPMGVAPGGIGAALPKGPRVPPQMTGIGAAPQGQVRMASGGIVQGFNGENGSYVGGGMPGEYALYGLMEKAKEIASATGQKISNVYQQLVQASRDSSHSPMAEQGAGITGNTPVSEIARTAKRAITSIPGINPLEGVLDSAVEDTMKYLEPQEEVPVTQDTPPVVEEKKDKPPVDNTLPPPAAADNTGGIASALPQQPAGRSKDEAWRDYKDSLATMVRGAREGGMAGIGPAFAAEREKQDAIDSASYTAMMEGNRETLSTLYEEREKLYGRLEGLIKPIELGGMGKEQFALLAQQLSNMDLMLQSGRSLQGERLNKEQHAELSAQRQQMWNNLMRSPDIFTADPALIMDIRNNIENITAQINALSGQSGGFSIVGARPAAGA